MMYKKVDRWKWVEGEIAHLNGHVCSCCGEKRLYHVTTNYYMDGPRADIFQNSYFDNAEFELKYEKYFSTTRRTFCLGCYEKRRGA